MKDEKKNTSAASGGIGFTGLLTIAFIVLKLTKVIDWSWWWVLSPIWISAAIVVFIIAIAIVAAFISDHRKKKRREQKS